MEDGKKKNSRLSGYKGADCMFARSGIPPMLYGFQLGNEKFLNCSIPISRQGYCCLTGSVIRKFL
jgi:hypothetical protein